MDRSKFGKKDAERSGGRTGSNGPTRVLAGTGDQVATAEGEVQYEREMDEIRGKQPRLKGDQRKSEQSLKRKKSAQDRQLKGSLDTDPNVGLGDTSAQTNAGANEGAGNPEEE